MNPFDLTGKVAIVTGGNDGLGFAMASGLARAGAAVGIVGRNSEKNEAAAKRIAEEFGVPTCASAADVTREADIAACVAQIAERLGPPTILVNNAGINIRRPPQDMTEAEWRSVMDTNLTSAFLMGKAVYPSMKAAGWGKIVNIGSMASIYGQSFGPAYAASKGGIVQLSKSFALAWATDGIRVNAILPGWFETPLTRKACEEIPGLYERVVARTPVARWGRPEELAGTVVWLSSPASDYVTGTAIPVDGGCTAWMV